MSRNEIMQREYQVRGSAFLAKPRDHGVILADDPGLGKSNQALCAIPLMTPEPESVLIIAPPSAHGVWQTEALAWLDEEVYLLAPNKQYKPTRIVVSSPDEAANLVQLPMTWDLIIIDEIHLFRNRTTKRYKGIRPLTKRSARVIGLTGSPIVNGVPDLWAQLSLVAPKQFTSYWSFLNKHCVTYVSTEGYNQTTGAVKNPKVFKKFLQPYMIRRRKDKVLDQLPIKTRQALYVHMTSEQQRLYDQLLNDLLAATENGVVLVDSVIAQITRLRQTLISPSLYGSDAPSAAINTVVDAIQFDFDAGIPVIIFTPYAQAIPVISAVLHRQLHRYAPSEYIIQGSMSGEARADTIRRFQTDNDKHKVMICTIGVATSFTATAASVGYFLGYDWTPANNIQAEDRMHRYGQKNPVHVKYVVHRNTVDEHILNILDRKVTNAELTENLLTFLNRTRKEIIKA